MDQGASKGVLRCRTTRIGRVWEGMNCHSQVDMRSINKRIGRVQDCKNWPLWVDLRSKYNILLGGGKEWAP